MKIILSKTLMFAALVVLLFGAVIAIKSWLGYVNLTPLDIFYLGL